MDKTPPATGEDIEHRPCGADWAGVIPEPDETPDVTVIVPTYNVGRYLGQCLETILENDTARLEVIVVNDGSQDKSLSIMREYEERDPRIHVIDKPNGGYGMSVNVGLYNAHGTYVAIVEPDDYLKPHFYDELIAYAKTFDELPDIVKTPYTRVTAPDSPYERLFHCAYYDRIKVEQPFTLHDEPRLIQHHPSIWSALYRRAFLEERDIHMLEVRGAGWVDNPFLIETYCQAKSIVYYDKEFYCYREDLPGSSSMLKSTNLAFERWNQMTDILDDLGIDDPGIRSAHNIRGFTYLAGIIEEADITGTSVVDKMNHMLDRMDPDLVLSSIYLNSDRKHMFCRARNITGRHWSFVPHLRSLIDEFVYSARTNGMYYALSRVRVYFARRMSIAAHDPTKTHSAGI